MLIFTGTYVMATKFLLSIDDQEYIKQEFPSNVILMTCQSLITEFTHYHNRLPYNSQLVTRQVKLSIPQGPSKG